MIWMTIFMALAVHIEIVWSREYTLRLKSNGPAIRGSTVTISAELYETNGMLANVGDTLKWEWLVDDHEKQEFKTNVPHAKWTYQFPKHSTKNHNITHKIDVSVGQWYIFFAYPMASDTVEVNVTETLNGEMKLNQSGQMVKPQNISTGELLEHKLDIRREDLDSIKNATSTVVHWFVDCQYVRETKDFKLNHIFNEPNKTHQIEALIESSFDAPATKPAPTLKSKLVSSWRTQHRADLPFICHNQSNTAPDPNKTYGYFTTNVTVFDPITDFVVNGSTWINDGDDYQINIFCSGSPNFEYCIRQFDGPYIMTGNETCDEWTTMHECQQNFTYPQSVLNVKSFTVLIIVRNNVSIERKLFVVNIKQPIILIAAVVGAVVFTLCIIAVIVCCLVRCIHKKRRISKKPIRSDAEASLIGHHPVKVNDTKHISNIIRS